MNIRDMRNLRAIASKISMTAAELENQIRFLESLEQEFGKISTHQDLPDLSREILLQEHKVDEQLTNVEASRDILKVLIMDLDDELYDLESRL